MEQYKNTGNGADFDRIVLEEQSEGCYIFLFRTETSSCPEEDYLADDLITAKEICLEDYGVQIGDWATHKGPSYR